MKPRERWKYIDEVSLFEAVMLILDIEPNRLTGPEDKFNSEKYDQIIDVLKADILNGKIKDNNPSKPPHHGHFEPFISLNSLKSWIELNNVSAPFFERLRVSKPVAASDLISLVLLSKAVALWYSMKIPEAYDWILNNISELSIYEIGPSTLPEQLEKSDELNCFLIELINSSWWDNPESLHLRFSYYDISFNEIAALKSEAFLIFDLPVPEINDVLQKIEDDESRLDISNSVDYVPSVKIDESTEHISNELKVLNQAAFEFWSTADPNDKNTHPTNDEVFNWLKKQGFSNISAKQGAVIIRPEWAASGRRPTK